MKTVVFLNLVTLDFLSGNAARVLLDQQLTKTPKRRNKVRRLARLDFCRFFGKYLVALHRASFAEATADQNKTKKARKSQRLGGIVVSVTFIFGNLTLNETFISPFYAIINSLCRTSVNLDQHLCYTLQ